MSEIAETISRNGYALFESCFPLEVCNQWIQILENKLSNFHGEGPLRSRAHTAITYGARNLLALCPDVTRLLMDSLIARWIRILLGDEFGVVRGLFFDKPLGANWSLPWHQDLTIAIRKPPPFEAACGGFSKLTLKAGVHHVEAPEWLLQRMLTVRIHLDEMHALNGPLLVRNGSHLYGKSNSDQDFSRLSEDSVQEIHCPRGSVMFMKPLLWHASNSSRREDLHRRTIHLELCNLPELPLPFQWHSYVRCS